MEITNCINYLLTAAQHEVFQTFSARLASFGVTPGQYGVLSCLWARGSATPKELAQELRMENSTVSGVLDRMQKRGLIDRILDPNDRRSLRVEATPKGMEIKEGVLRAVEELNVQVLEGFSEEEKAFLLDSLRRIAAMTLPGEA